jgi:hypothetical protein
MSRTGGKPFDELVVPAQGNRRRVDKKERMDDRADSASSSQPVGALDGQPPFPVEALQELLGGLVLEREELRRMGADRSTLERNRRDIVRAQWQLSHALIARHRPGAAAA